MSPLWTAVSEKPVDGELEAYDPKGEPASSFRSPLPAHHDGAPSCRWATRVPGTWLQLPAARDGSR